MEINEVRALPEPAVYANGEVGEIKIPCPFCDLEHIGLWDEVDEQIMKCRDRVSPRKRGDLAAYNPDEFNHYTVTVENSVPRGVVFVEDRSGILNGPQRIANGGDPIPMGNDPSSDYRC